MRHIQTDPELNHLFKRVLHYANEMGRTLPEMRFFILDPLEFASLLEKNVYPRSPMNIWEGRNMVKKKMRIKSGQESALYYEVVQTGNPSYGYLNNTNNAMMQASVMAHVVGHCEFSELNVLKDSNPDRTEQVMFLVNRINRVRDQMGMIHYQDFWNACESITPLIYPNSQYNLENSIDTDLRKFPDPDSQKEQVPSNLIQPYSSTLGKLFDTESLETAFKRDLQKKIHKETLSRKGYRLRAPCQDVFGFLRHYAPASEAERYILDYLYVVHKPQDFVIRTQIMNEGWAMYWEKKIMLELFKEKAVKGVVDYAKVFSGVCYPRPFFMRNPYHLGYHMWCHIEELYKKGKISLDYVEESEQAKKDDWDQGNATVSPHERMTHLVRTITDYEFIRRYLTHELIFEFHLNRISKRMAPQLGIKTKDIVQENDYWIWIDPEATKFEMLEFFTHFNRPRIYVIDDNFKDGGLLLYHLDDGQKLKESWIGPALKNLHYVWKAPVYLLSKHKLYQRKSDSFQKSDVKPVSFDQVIERISNHEPPLKL